MKKLIYLIVPFALLINACGPETNKDDKHGIDSVAPVDSLAEKKPVDPMAPPNDDYTGDHVVKDKSGNITLVRGFFRFGKRHGKWAAFYPTGELQSETEYNNGKREGKSIVWYVNGKTEYEGTYKEDQKTGTWKFYNEDGTLSQEVKY